MNSTIRKPPPNTAGKAYFTIATITLNNNDGIKKTWESLKKQTSQNYEWLVQDGKSTDRSLKFLQNIAKTAAIPPHVESRADTGIYDAMNRLIQRSQAMYILFLNAGDQLASNETLEHIEHALADYQKSHNTCPDFIYADALEYDHTTPQPRYKKARSHQYLARGMFTHHQSMLYARHKLEQHALKYNTHYTIAADYDFTCRFLKNTYDERVLYIPQPICIFEPGGISQSNTQTGRKEQITIRKQLKLCSPASNIVITFVQYCTMLLRTIAPNLYWSLKNKY